MKLSTCLVVKINTTLEVRPSPPLPENTTTELYNTCVFIDMLDMFQAIYLSTVLVIIVSYNKGFVFVFDGAQLYVHGAGPSEG